MKWLKRNNKIILAFILGIILTGTGGYAATTIMGSNVTYSNTKSGLSSTNVQGAIDELYEKVDIRKTGKFVAVYTYNQKSGASNYCVTGKEATCQKTTCYKTKTANSCKAGTIIKYKVNDTTIVNFHVMFDNGNTITMQSQGNIVYNTDWANKKDYQAAGGEHYTNGYPLNDKGPVSILPTIENATSGWSNVNDQTYALGTTSLSDKGEQTVCNSITFECTGNSYVWPERTAKARMMTTQEAKALGCSSIEKSCPIWIYNYLDNSTGYGGTNNDTMAGGAYWLINGAYNPNDNNANYGGISILYHGNLSATSNHMFGSRAVVKVSK